MYKQKEEVKRLLDEMLSKKRDNVKSKDLAKILDKRHSTISLDQ